MVSDKKDIFANVKPKGCNFIYRASEIDGTLWNIKDLGNPEFVDDKTSGDKLAMLLPASTWSIPKDFNAPVFFTMPFSGTGLCMCNSQGDVYMAFSPAPLGGDMKNYKEVQNMASSEMTQTAMHLIAMLKKQMKTSDESQKDKEKKEEEKSND